MTALPASVESRAEAVGLAEIRYLLQRVQNARAALEAQRCQPRTLTANPEQLRLLNSLESYAAALQSRHLPVPPTIRDELQLQRCLLSRRTVSRSATRSPTDRR